MKENTGLKIYTILIQISNTTGQPTGITKPNVPEDPDYIPPIYDPIQCPTSAQGESLTNE